MIRILHVVHALTRGGGLCNFIMNYYRNMDRSKVQFDFIYFKEAENDFKEEIRELGGRYFRWHEPQMNFAFLKEAKHFFAQHANEYRAMHCHALFALPAYAGIARKYGVRHIIAHSHSVGYGEHGFLRKIRNYCFVRSCRLFADERLACSENAAQFMFGTRLCTAGKVLIIQNAVDCDRFRFDAERREKIRKEMQLDGKTVIGHAGGFTAQKNHDFLADLFYEFHKSHPDSVLLLVGGEGIASGSTMSDIRLKVKQLGLQDSVIFTGIRSDVDAMMLCMDIFLFPSLFEGFGLVLVEAQASGLQCIASANVPQDAKCTENIVFLPLDNMKAWLEKTESMLNNRKSRISDISLFGRYNIKLNAKKLESFYLSLS